MGHHRPAHASPCRHHLSQLCHSCCSCHDAAEGWQLATADSSCDPGWMLPLTLFSLAFSAFIMTGAVHPPSRIQKNLAGPVPCSVLACVRRCLTCPSALRSSILSRLCAHRAPPSPCYEAVQRETMSCMMHSARFHWGSCTAQPQRWGVGERQQRAQGAACCPCSRWRSGMRCGSKCRPLPVRLGIVAKYPLLSQVRCHPVMCL